MSYGAQDKKQPVVQTPIGPKRLTLQQQDFLKSPAGLAAQIELKQMASSPDYNTRSIFSSRIIDGMPFAERHMQYLCEHPKLNPRHYISNLRLMTKIKS